MPAAILDLQLLEKNIQAILNRCGDTPIRIATKSIRSRFVLDTILNSSKQFIGLMAYTANEAVWLASLGYKNILIGYPTTDWESVKKICEEKHTSEITFMVDDVFHIHELQKIGEKYHTSIRICIDIDMSTSFPGLYFGVYRSPLHTVEDVQKLMAVISKSDMITLVGMMGYEAQVAGLGDEVKSESIKNYTVKFLKRKSQKDYSKRRKEVVDFLKKQVVSLEIVNAGGTGSIEWSKEEQWINEITVGSGFYSPSLFDSYADFKHEPALFFGLPVVRTPRENMYTCFGGGYIASGELTLKKQPVPYLPIGMEIIKTEGFGEVQTPIVYKGDEKIGIGSPLFFRHAKAGELCEHFNELVIINQGKITTEKTYRGEGMSF